MSCFENMTPAGHIVSSLGLRLFSCKSVLSSVKEKSGSPSKGEALPSGRNCSTRIIRNSLNFQRWKTLFCVLTSVLIALALFSGTANGQKNPVDSLKQALREVSDDSTKLAILLDLTQELLNVQNSSAKEYLQQASKLAQKYPHSHLHAMLLLRWGRYYSFVGNLDKAANFYHRAIQEAESLGDSTLVEYALNNFAVLDMKIGNYRRGIRGFKRLLRIAQSKGDHRAEVEYLLNLATAYGQAGMRDSSKQSLMAMYSSPQAQRFYRTVAANNLSFVYNEEKNYRKAEQFAREAIRLQSNVPNTQLLLESLTNLSNALIGQKKYRQAEKVTRRLVRIATTHHFREQLVNGLDNLATIYERLGDYQRALQFHQRYAAQKDSLLNERALKQINELQIRYESEKKDREIAQRTNELRETRLKLVFAVGTGILTILLSSFIIFLYARQSAAYKELVRKNLELMNSAQAEQELRSESPTRAASGNNPVSSIPPEKRAELLQKLETAISEEKIYLRNNLTIEKLAAELGINSRYLSALIHWRYRTNFPNLIKWLRVSEARRMLADRSFNHYSIEGIAKTVGFSSKSSFHEAFKKITGLTPSYFRQEAQKFPSQS